MSTANRMSKVSGDPRLCQMVIPGSHDAGVYGDSLVTRKSSEAFALSGFKYLHQALSGSRMFDCRVFVKYSKEEQKIVPTMGHFFREKAKHGKHDSRGSMGAYKYSQGATVACGLATCGTYTNTQKEMKEVHSNAFSAADEHKNHSQDDHPHFVYWQQTVGLADIKKATTEKRKTKGGVAKNYTGGAHANLDTFIQEIQANTGHRPLEVAQRDLARLREPADVQADLCAEPGLQLTQLLLVIS